ncbi:MAG: chemotaxis protein CheW [Halanaerobiaceae bacterium]
MDNAKKDLQDNTLDILNQQLTNITAENQYVTFLLGEEEYGVDVLKVQEIIRYNEPTKIPNIPDVIAGVANSRGEIIPIIDMRIKFNMKKIEYNSFNIIIVIEVKDSFVGIIVDEVSDIISFNSEDIQKTPEFTSDIKTEHIRGMGKTNNRLILLLDTDKLLTFKEYTFVKETKRNIEND